MLWTPTKPGISTRIDWTDPLSQGLVGCWLFNEGGGYKANGHGGIFTATAGSWGVGGFITDGTTISGALQLANNAGASAFNFEGNFTVTIVFRPINPSGGNQTLIAKGYGIATTYPFAINWDFANNRWSFLRKGTTGTAVGALFLHGNANTVSIMTIGKSGSNVFCATTNKNSFLYQTATDTTTGTHDNTQPLTLGMRDNGFFQHKAEYKSTFIHNRALSAQEIQQLHEMTKGW